MKIQLKIYLTLIILGFIGHSCNEDEFLEHDYVNAVVSDNFLTIPSHADKAVVGMYNVLLYHGLYSFDRLILGSSAADEIVEDHNDPLWSQLIDLDKYRWKAENAFVWEHWTDNYTGIMMANSIVNKVPEIEGMDNVLGVRYVAEAKALRALFYYNLVTAHGGVPVFSEVLSPPAGRNITRASEQEVWDQILADLNDAVAGLPDAYEKADDKGRVTKGFANTLLSKAYLWQKDYTNAASTALEVINSPAGYALEAEYADLFNGVSEFSKERIFGINFASGIEGSIWSRVEDVTNRWYMYGPFASWSWFYQTSRDFVDAEVALGDTRMDTVTLDMRNGEKYDLNNDGVIDSKDKIPANPPVDTHLMKWVPFNQDLTNTGEVYLGNQGFVDILVFRYAEVLLNYAEALVELGRENEALPFINEIRIRAKLDKITTTSTSELRDIILHERKVEFCFEGKRFFDLKRVGRLEEFLGPLGFKKGIHENFPIPQTEIDLTKMEQNPGYN